MKTVVEQFENGLKVVLNQNRGSGVVAFQAWVGVGSADERKGEEGIAHVFEHMIFKGTKSRPVGEITRDVERLGGQINAWTSPDETVFYITLAGRYWSKGLEILADAIQNSSLDSNELEKELMVIREEIRMGEDSPERSVTRALFKSVFRKHPYGRPVIGFDRTVKGFKRKNVLDFFLKWYVPANMVLSIAGDFDSKAVLAKARSLFLNMKARPIPKRSTRTAEPTQKRTRFSYLTKPVSEAHLAIGFPIPGLKHKDVPALDLLAAVLGQGASSKMEIEIRRKAKAVNTIQTMAYTAPDAGIFGVFATLPPKNLELATKLIFEETAKLTKFPVTADDLKKAQTLLESDKVYSEETVDGVARKLGFYQLHAQDIEFEDKYLAMISKCTQDDIIEAARRYFNFSAVNAALVLPSAKKASTAKLDRVISQSIRSVSRPAATVKARHADGEIVIHKTSTGDVLIMRRDPSSKLVAARAAFFGGSRFEKPSKSGVFTLMTKVLTKGADGMSSEEIALQMDSMACTIEGFSGRNTFGIGGEFLKSNFEAGLCLMAKCLRKPSFPENEVELEKALQKEDIRASLLNPGHVAFDLFSNALFKNHPYGKSMLGTEQTLESLDRLELVKLLDGAALPSKMVMAIEGGLDIGRVIELVEREFSKSQKSSRLKASFNREPAQWNEPTSPIRLAKDMQKEQSHVVVGFKGTTFTGQDRFALEVLREILGGHGGRLFESVREKKGLAYHVTAMSQNGIEPGYIALYAATTPGKEREVVEAMLDEAKQIGREPVPSAELVRVKRHLIGAKAIANQRVSVRATNTVLDYIYGNGADEADRYGSRIDAVTAEEVQQAAFTYLNPPKRVVVCVGPNAEKLPLDTF